MFLTLFTSDYYFCQFYICGDVFVRQTSVRCLNSTRDLRSGARASASKCGQWVFPLVCILMLLKRVLKLTRNICCTKEAGHYE